MGKLEFVVPALVILAAFIGIYFMYTGAGWAAKYYFDVSPGQVVLMKPGMTYTLNHLEAGRFKIRIIAVRDNAVDVDISAFKGESRGLPTTISSSAPGVYEGLSIVFVEKTPGGFVRLRFD